MAVVADEVRVDAVPVRNADRNVTYCDLSCIAPMQETWQIGDFAYGATLGLRLLLR